MGVGQPCMKRKNRHFDREAQREGKEDPFLNPGWDCRTYRVELQEIGCKLSPWPQRSIVPQPDNCHKHQETPSHRVEEEFNGRVNLVLPTPDADDEVHGNKHRLPENVEQEQVKRAEDPEHSCL